MKFHDISLRLLTVWTENDKVKFPLIKKLKDTSIRKEYKPQYRQGTKNKRVCKDNKADKRDR